VPVARAMSRGWCAHGWIIVNVPRCGALVVPVQTAGGPGFLGGGLARCRVLKKQPQPPVSRLPRGAGGGCFFSAARARLADRSPLSRLFLRVRAPASWGAGLGGGGGGGVWCGCWRVRGSWGVCELDSGCEHLVVDCPPAVGRSFREGGWLRCVVGGLVARFLCCSALTLSVAERVSVRVGRARERVRRGVCK
jgi:hypothetical protein